MVSNISKIEDAINSIPEKKEKLRKSLESLQSYSSSLASLTLDWKDLEDHFSSIEKSIDERFRALKEKEKGIQNQEEEEEEEEEAKEDPHPHDDAAAAAEGEPTPRPELRSLCVNMDGKGLRAYVSENRKDLVALREELAPAIRCAPDPAVLVLDAMHGFYPPNSSSSDFKNKNKRKGKGGDNEEDGETQINRRICINLLEKLHLVSPNIGPSVRERANKLAFDWKSMIPKFGDNCLESLGFLNLIAAYGLVSEFPTNQILELFVSVSRRKQAVDLLKSLGLVDKLPELIQKLNKKGRQLDAVKFIYALKEVEKYPPVPLLKAYITEAKKIAKEVREKGNHSARAQNEATAKELGALKSVLKAVEEYKLENEYPRVGLVKRITQLEHKKAEKKRSVIATATAAAKSQQQEQQSKKRPRLSPTTSAAVMTANPYHRHHHHQHPPMIHTQPQLGLADRAPYIGVPSSYDLASSSAYVHSHGIGAPSLGGSMLDHGRTRSPPPTSYYSSQSLQGTSSLYDRPMTYNGYVPGLPPSYGSSLYP